MSLEIFLARFGPSSDEVPKHPDVLRDLERITRIVLRKAGKDDDIAIEAAGGSFSIDLPGGTATVNPTYAQFPIQELDPLTLRVIFEVAKLGDMVIITEGGRTPAILTNAAQNANLPEGWIDEGQEVPVCFSPEQLEQLLQDWYHTLTGYIKRVISHKQRGGEPDLDSRNAP